MKIITNELRDIINELAKNNPVLSDAISASNEKTFDYSVHKNNRYQEMFEKCKASLEQALKEKFAESGESFDYKDFISDFIPDSISSNMPEQDNILFEMIQDRDFDYHVNVDYEMPGDNLAIHVRSFLDECCRDELHDAADDIWQEILEEQDE